MKLPAAFGIFARMPLFYFDVYNDDVTIDEIGEDLPDLAAARDKALREVRNLAAESIRSEGHLVLDHRIELRDEGGQVVDRIHFEDGVRVCRTGPC